MLHTFIHDGFRSTTRLAVDGRGYYHTHVKFTKVLQKSRQESGSGLIKIELTSTEDVKMVLKEKRRLKTAPAKELHDIYLCQSKSEESLVAERNQDVILREMGVRDEYI